MGLDGNIAAGMTNVKDKRVTVAGLGRFGGGIAVVRWLVAQGAVVLVTDLDSPESLADSVAQIGDLPITLRLGGHDLADFTGADLVVASPAVPPSSPYLAGARAAGVPITTEIRLFIERCSATIVGVTGTKGKSTTTAMLGRMLARRYTTHVGGNLGGSLLDTLRQISATDIVVLELSSYMLEHLAVSRWSPHVAVVTMIAPDHLAWHGSMAAYVNAKNNIVRFQRPDDYAILNAADPAAAAMASQTPARVVLYQIERPFELRLPGKHNQLNAHGAFAAARVLGVTWDDAQAALADFPGLPHRLQLVVERDDIRWFNDSIATVPDAAIAALYSFPTKRVIQIVGGYDSKAAMIGMCNALIERAKAVLCIGATGREIGTIIAAATSQSGAASYQCGDLATAVRMARSIALPGDVVLLSPGCKSYDQFVNFEQRGQRFSELAKEAAAIIPAAKQP